MKILTIIFCLFLSVNIMAQKRDTIYMNSAKKIVFKNGKKGAYILIDSTVFNGRLENIDTSIVASICILKPKFAVDTYGKRALNGAILITTRSYVKTQKAESRGLYNLRSDAISYFVLGNTNGMVGIVTPNTKVEAKTIAPSLQKEDRATHFVNFLAGDPPCSVDTGSSKGDNSLYIVDGQPQVPGNKIKPGDILNVSILNGNDAAKLYGQKASNGATVIISKHYATTLYQKKFAAISKKYKDYLATKHTDTSLMYVLNNVIMNQQRKSTIQRLYELSPDSIAKINFRKEPRFKTDATVEITTKKQD